MHLNCIALFGALLPRSHTRAQEACFGVDLQDAESKSAAGAIRSASHLHAQQSAISAPMSAAAPDRAESTRLVSQATFSRPSSMSFDGLASSPRPGSERFKMDSKSDQSISGGGSPHATSNSAPWVGGLAGGADRVPMSVEEAMRKASSSAYAHSSATERRNATPAAQRMLALSEPLRQHAALPLSDATSLQCPVLSS